MKNSKFTDQQIAFTLKVFPDELREKTRSEPYLCHEEQYADRTFTEFDSGSGPKPSCALTINAALACSNAAIVVVLTTHLR